jgi:hypothetical protein
LSRIYPALGERVAADDPLGKTLRPYMGTDETRFEAFQFEIRLGANTPHRAVNPEPLMRPLDKRTGAIAARLTDLDGVPLRQEAIRGARKDKPLYVRYAHSLTYPRGVNSLGDLGENAYIGDLPPGRHRLFAAGKSGTAEVRPGQITLVEWPVAPGGDE